MKIPTKFNKCIICLENPVTGLEHIIPECIGGRLQSNILCSSCNNKLGSEVVSKIKTDPTFRLAIEALKTQLPSLCDQFLEKANYLGFSGNGSSIRLSKRGTKLKILPNNNKEKSVLELDNNDVKKYLLNHLQRALQPEDEIRKVIEFFEELDNHEPILIPTGEILEKVPIERVEPDLSGVSVDNKIWIIIAYEFLSLVIGREIYHAYFDQVRDFILTGNGTQNIAIGSFQGSKTYEANHFLGIDPKDDRLIVYIKLFGWIFQRVTFFKVSGKIMDIVYYEDLKNRKSLIALNREDAKRSVWLEVI